MRTSLLSAGIGTLGVEFEYRLLKWVSPGAPAVCSGAAYAGRSKIATLLGDRFLAQVRGKTVIDFGCGEGADSLDLARAGASRVIGIDIQESFLEQARRRARASGLEDICEFSTGTTETADLIVSLDSFEHFDDPAAVLRTMDSLLRPGGEVLASFGPTWYHPNGGHLFSVFPWAHLIFAEKSLIRWRSTFKTDGAKTFRECQGGLNQMTIRRFEKLVEASPFRFAELEAVPIRRLRRLHTRLTREFTTSIVRCRLQRRASVAHAR